MEILGGIFVGGAATRFGGVAKGLLRAPDGSGSILDRLVALLRAHEITPVLVGQHAEYMDLGLPAIPDRGDALGPLGGLLALYEHARGRRALALACDMPFLTTLAPLLDTPAALAAARRDGRWEPFYSVHDPRIVAPVAERLASDGRRSLQALFDAVPAVEIAVAPRELDDWDSPADQARTIPIRTMSK